MMRSMRCWVRRLTWLLAAIFPWLNGPWPLRIGFSVGLPWRYQLARLMPSASHGCLTLPPSGGFLGFGPLDSRERLLMPRPRGGSKRIRGWVILEIRFCAPQPPLIVLG